MPVRLFVIYFLLGVALSIHGEAQLLKGLRADDGSACVCAMALPGYQGLKQVNVTSRNSCNLVVFTFFLDNTGGSS